MLPPESRETLTLTLTSSGASPTTNVTVRAAVGASFDLGGFGASSPPQAASVPAVNTDNARRETVFKLLRHRVDLDSWTEAYQDGRTRLSRDAGTQTTLTPSCVGSTQRWQVQRALGRKCATSQQIYPLSAGGPDAGPVDPIVVWRPLVLAHLPDAYVGAVARDSRSGSRTSMAHLSSRHPQAKTIRLLPTPPRGTGQSSSELATLVPRESTIHRIYIKNAGIAIPPALDGPHALPL